MLYLNVGTYRMCMLIMRSILRNWLTCLQTLANPKVHRVVYAQSCSTLCNPMNCSLPGSSVHGIFQQEYWSGFLLQGQGRLAGQRSREMLQVQSKGSLLAEFLLLEEVSLSLLRPLNVQMRLLHFVNNLLSSRSIDLNINLIKNTFTSRIMFDQIIWAPGLAKFTYRISHHTQQ